MSEATHGRGPSTPRWTHVALRVADIDASITWYEEYTPLRLLERREDPDGYGAWLGEPDNADRPFVLVLSQFLPDRDPFAGTSTAVLTPFSHLGVELPDRAAVDEIASRAEAAGHLAMAPTQMPDPVGYICMLNDPDGNLVEFSFDQGVYEKARQVWG